MGQITPPNDPARPDELHTTAGGLLGAPEPVSALPESTITRSLSGTVSATVPTLGPLDEAQTTVGAIPDFQSTTVGDVISLTGLTRGLPVVPGYQVESELGRGGMGVVYKARQVKLNRVVALKMILSGTHASKEAGVRFLAEAEAAAKLQHPGVVQIFHIAEQGGYPYIEMEYVAGGSLADRLDGVPRPPREAARLIEGLASAIGEAHRQGIIHRDLKPGNVLMTPDGDENRRLRPGQVPERGFGADGDGLDPRLAELHGAGAGRGKTKMAGPRTDLYALGAILYELLTGRPPFRGATALETIQQVKTAEPVPPSRLVPGLPRDVETIALKCLQKDPARRYESGTALAEDLRRFRSGETILARPVGPLARTARWCRRNPVVASLLATLLVVLSGGLAAVTTLYLRADRLRGVADVNFAAADRARDVAASGAETLRGSSILTVSIWRTANAWPTTSRRPAGSSSRATRPGAAGSGTIAGRSATGNCSISGALPTTPRPARISHTVFRSTPHLAPTDAGLRWPALMGQSALPTPRPGTSRWFSEVTKEEFAAWHSTMEGNGSSREATTGRSGSGTRPPGACRRFWPVMATG